MRAQRGDAAACADWLEALHALLFLGCPSLASLVFSCVLVFLRGFRVPLTMVFRVPLTMGSHCFSVLWNMLPAIFSNTFPLLPCYRDCRTSRLPCDLSGMSFCRASSSCTTGPRCCMTYAATGFHTSRCAATRQTWRSSGRWSPGNTRRLLGTTALKGN